MQWKPTTLDEVRAIVKDDLEKCDPDQIASFRQVSVEPHFAPIRRYGKLEKVVIVARKLNDVMYWEDVEEGFNISPLGPNGLILEHWCNQDDLGVVRTNGLKGGRAAMGNSSRPDRLTLINGVVSMGRRNTSRNPLTGGLSS
jgi:hypothetical protein